MERTTVLLWEHLLLNASYLIFLLSLSLCSSLLFSWLGKYSWAPDVTEIFHFLPFRSLACSLYLSCAQHYLLGEAILTPEENHRHKETAKMPLPVFIIPTKPILSLRICTYECCKWSKFGVRYSDSVLPLCFSSVCTWFEVGSFKSHFKPFLYDMLDPACFYV